MSLTLSARPRTRTGRHAASLRREGVVPAVVYGHGQPSLAIEADARELERLWMHAGHTQLVDLHVEGHRMRRVLIRELQVHPRSGRALHADFFAVNLRERTTAEVPVVLHGESPAVAAKQGVVLQVVSMVRVEALPADLPGQLTADVAALVAADSAITAGELPLPHGVTLLSDPSEVVAKISGRRVRGAMDEEEEEAAEAAAAAEEASAEGGEEPSAEAES